MKKINEFVDEISKKYEYSETLNKDLKRIIPIMLTDEDDNKSQMLFDMLQETKIFVLPFSAKVEDLNKCKAEIFGKNNEGVTFVDGDNGEYGKVELPDGAYISEPIFDDDMNITGRNRMLFVKEISEWSSLRETYDSNINLSHLIHEIGHAWAAQKDEYIQNEDGSFVQNVGAGSILHSVDRKTKQVKGEQADGIFIEETLNTIFEEETLLKLTGMPNMDELRKKGYITSSYQGLMKNMMESYIDKFGIQRFDRFRFSKDKEVLADIETVLGETEAWGILNSSKYVETKKKTVIDAIDGMETDEASKTKIKNFFEQYDSVYFGSNDKFTPIQKINNVLEQVYDFNSIKYSFNMLGNNNNLEAYKKVMSSMIVEANALRNEARDIDKTIERKEDMMTFLKQGVQDDKKVEEYYKEKADKTVAKEIEDRDKGRG